MTAVERLLAHAEGVVVFFNERFARQYDLDALTAASVHRNLATYTNGVPHCPPAFELKNGTHPVQETPRSRPA